ncbi:MAG TPA: hypothetical protein VNE62_02585 [Actinomycetota bacterium]|nr:hypothetical protein [Actinomycetota bacterium]
MKPRSAAMVCVVALLSGGCGGPKVPLKVGSKNVSVNVSFGKRSEQPGPQGAPAPVQVLPLEGGVVFAPTQPGEQAPPRPTPIRRANDPVPPSGRCTTSPFAVPEKEATPFVDAPPANATYEFRVAGSIQSDDGLADYPDVVRRTVSSRRNSDGTNSFTVVESGFGQSITSEYLTDANQIGLVRITIRKTKTTRTIGPLRPPVMVLPLPPQSTDPTGRAITTWTSAGTDVTGGSVQVDGRSERTAADKRIDTCGSVLDSWAAVTSMRIVGPGLDVTSSTRTNFATQYGGLIVSERVKTSGTFGGSYQTEYAATINSVPQ